MKTIIALLLICTTSLLYAQETENATNDDNSVEVDAEYPGGRKAMIRFLSKNVHYPRKIAAKGIEGSVVIRFVVDEKGKIQNPKIQIGFPRCPKCEMEAIRVIKKMPKWKPALKDNIPVKAYFDLPIAFRLD